MTSLFKIYLLFFYSEARYLRIIITHLQSYILLFINLNIQLFINLDGIIYVYVIKYRNFFVLLARKYLINLAKLIKKKIRIIRES